MRKTRQRMVDRDSLKPWRRLGISKTWWYAIKGGHRAPSLEMALRIYDILGIQCGATEGLEQSEIDVLRKALNKSTPTIDISRPNNLQNDDGELRADSPRDRERVSAAKDQQEREGS